MCCYSPLQVRCITRDLKWGTPVPLDGYEDKVGGLAIQSSWLCVLGVVGLLFHKVILSRFEVQLRLVGRWVRKFCFKPPARRPAIRPTL